MPDVYISAEDNDGNIQLLEFLGADEGKALEEFHKLYDADQEIDQATEMGYVDPKAHVVHVNDVRRYVLLNVFLPLKIYVYLLDGCLNTIYTNLPLEIEQINEDDQAEEPLIITKEEPLPIEALMTCPEKFLDDSGTIAQNDQFQIISTFHDYTIYLKGTEELFDPNHGMGDGVDDCEWNPGTYGHQQYMQNLIDTQASMLMEAYFPEYIKE